MFSDHVADAAFQNVSFHGLTSRHAVCKEYWRAIRVDNVTPSHFQAGHVVKTVKEYFIQSSEGFCLQVCFIGCHGGIHISKTTFSILKVDFYDGEILIFVER